MRFLLILLFHGLLSLPVRAQQPATPDQLYGELFYDVQTSRIFPDSKTFVDCIPKRAPAEIVADYLAMKNNPAVRFSLELFVKENFVVPQDPKLIFETREKGLVAHINTLWTVLRRKADSTVAGSSLLPLPNEYIVPGGRFREIYYWDSYFTMLGLKESREYELIESMVKNFAYLISEYGHVPNGNRSYYLSRSQPPFFSLMLDLLASVKGEEVYVIYLPALKKEYDYWMDRTAPTRHLVKLPDGATLNRYWDQLEIPRQESYLEDRAVANQKKMRSEDEKTLYRDLRSAAESGWDFSSRWLKDGKNLGSIQTTRYIPVDLNCLLYHLERTLARAYQATGARLQATLYEQLAGKRKKALLKYCWSPAKGWFVDYNFITRRQSASLTLAGMFPYFFQLADSAQFIKSTTVLEKRFLKEGGLVTTLAHTGQQWDAPNGWAPLQWISIMGLENYGEQKMAAEVARRWYGLNKKVFDATGKLMEKYDVENASKEGGGGEYPSQDGFGWTNGVLLALINHYKLQ